MFLFCQNHFFFTAFPAVSNRDNFNCIELIIKHRPVYWRSCTKWVQCCPSFWKYRKWKHFPVISTDMFITHNLSLKRNIKILKFIGGYVGFHFCNYSFNHTKPFIFIVYTIHFWTLKLSSGKTAYNVTAGQQSWISDEMTPR